MLHIELTGSGRIDVYRTKATGARITVGGTQFSGDNAVIEFEIGLDAFEDGGWIWFDITTDSEVTLHNAGWYSPTAAPGRASIAVGIPTFNRPNDCVNALKALTSDPLVDKVITAVIVPDQGTKKVKDHPEWAAASGPLEGRLRVHDQPNLGGSGGYSRVMYEALKNTDCEQILYMDDDIRIEPDSILRALALNRFAKSPMLVGGQMLNLQEPSHLHVMGEVVNRDNFMWTNAPFAEYDHDFAKFALDDIEQDRSKLLHRRIDVDFNGWWMCMIPALSPRSWANRCRCSSSGMTPSTGFAPTSTATARRRCRVPRSGTWRGATRTTPSTGRPTSTCVTDWWLLPCIGTTTFAVCWAA